MKLLKFNNGEELLTDLCFNNTLVTIKSPKINTSGFKVCSEDGKVVIRNATAYTTLYDKNENEYILSCDGRVKPEPKPHIPVETLITVDSYNYVVFDFTGHSFLTMLTPEIAKEAFKDATVIVHGDEVYKNLEFVDAYETEINGITYTQVMFYQKNEIEVRLDNLEENVAVVADGVMENYEATEELSERTNTQEDAILELYEMIGGTE